MGDVPTEERTSLSERLAIKLKQADEAESYMVAVWFVKGGFLQYYRVTSGFPVDEFKNALGQIKNDLGKEQIESGLPHPESV